MKSPKVIGVDLDNTIISYDKLMHKLAVKRGLIKETEPSGKTSIRDQIRKLSNGEVEWQRIQAMAYGPHIMEANLIEGVREFFATCRQKKIKVFIVSHKTEYSNLGEDKTNLRESALSWMETQNFFAVNGLGLNKKSQVIFESTREEKVKRVASLGCQWFIDDLEETFLEKDFPTDVKGILFAPSIESAKTVTLKQKVKPQLQIMKNWKEIANYFFAA